MLRRLLATTFFVVLFFVLCSISFGQAVANDDFYVVDSPQYINTYENDVDYVGGWQMVIVTPPTHGGLSGPCTAGGLGCCPYCVYYSPSSTYKGFDSFTYQYVPCCGAPSGTPSSNVATVSLLLIGYSGAGSCPVPPFPSPLVGHPVNVANGNMLLQQKDYILPGLGDNIEVNRFYNSITQNGGLFGLGWTTKYDESLMIATDNKMIQLNEPDGGASYFGRSDTANPFISFSRNVGQIVQNMDTTYTLTYKDGRVHKFDSTGLLIWQKDRNGNQTSLNYTSGVLTGITDAVGRTLTISTGSNGNVSQISDALGTVATYEYYASTSPGQLKTVTYNDGSKYKFEYTTIGSNTYLTTVKDAFDNVLESHSYDTSGRATTSEKDGGVESLTFDYSGSDFVKGNYTAVTDALGNVTKYFHTRQYGTDLITETDGVCSCGGGGSEATTYTYNTSNSWLNLKSKTDALSNETDYSYDSARNLTSLTDVLGTQSFTYNSHGEALTETDRMGGVTTNTYSTAGNLLTTTDALSNTSTLAYTSAGELATFEDALSNTTTLSYDSHGLVTQVTDANGKNTSYGYDSRARLTSTTNALTQTTSFAYDDDNRLNKITFPDANYIGATYDLAGRRTAVTDPLGHTTTYAYDRAYRLTSITDALSHATSFGYDLMSNLTSQTDALGNVTNYEYDDFNRLKKVRYPTPTTGATRLEEDLTYNKLGKVTTRVDTAGHTTSFDYDAASRLTTITDPLSHQTQFTYNARSQMTKVKDALNQEYTFTYDPLGRNLSQTRAGTTMSFEYDEVGNRTKRIDYDGQETDYDYDALNRLDEIDYIDQADSSTYTYDDLSRLVSAANEAGTVTFSYDNRNRIKTETDVFEHVKEYDYDAAGNRKLLKLDGDAYTSYDYDNANRLTTLTDDSSNDFTFGYDNANKLTSKTMPNGITSTFDYDGMSRLTRLKHQTTGSTMVDNQYSYNSANQISQIAELSQTKNFTYDNANRLTAETNGTTSESYSYDAVGNRTTSQFGSSYSYDPFNLMVRSPGASGQNFTETYDANGNMLSKLGPLPLHGWAPGNSYGYDSENRMTQMSVSGPGPTIIHNYTYDALGRRVKSDDNSFTYDGNDVILDGLPSEGEVTISTVDVFQRGALHPSEAIVGTVDGDPVPPTTSIVTKYQNAPGIDNKLKLTNDAGSSYFLQDHLGSTVGLTDSSGGVTDSNSYDSFGNPSNTSFSTRFQYTGRELDLVSRIQYNRARWYDSNLGRFISEDPIGFGGGDVNLYGYVKNEPLRMRDPSGLQGEEVAVPLVGVGVASIPFLPEIGVATAGGSLIYGSYYVGEFTANHPWNPFVNGPWPLNPLKPPLGYPIPVYPPSSPTVRPGPACQPMPRSIPWALPRSIPWQGEPDDDPDERGCDKQLQADEAVCSQITDSQMRGACFAHAFDRWASCNAGRNIPHNPWPSYPWD